jgi:hypothetical protein
MLSDRDYALAVEYPDLGATKFCNFINFIWS